MRIYIAGPMTGLPEFNFPAFNDAEQQLRAAGHDPVNPARHGAGEPSLEWADYMRRDIPDLLGCEGLALLEGWGSSRGAQLEHRIATELGITVRYLDDWLGTRLPLGHAFDDGGSRFGAADRCAVQLARFPCGRPAAAHLSRNDTARLEETR